MKKLTDEQFLALLEKETNWHNETLKIKKERQLWRKQLVKDYWITFANYYIRKKKHEPN